MYSKEDHTEEGDPIIIKKDIIIKTVIVKKEDIMMVIKSIMMDIIQEMAAVVMVIIIDLMDLMDKVVNNKIKEVDGIIHLRYLFKIFFRNCLYVLKLKIFYLFYDRNVKVIMKQL